jgi:hypothetical protein
VAVTARKNRERREKKRSEEMWREEARQQDKGRGKKNNSLRRGSDSELETNAMSSEDEKEIYKKRKTGGDSGRQMVS